MILQPPTEVRELNGGNRTWHATVFGRVQPLLTWIHQHAVAMDVALIVG